MWRDILWSMKSQVKNKFQNVRSRQRAQLPRDVKTRQPRVITNYSYTSFFSKPLWAYALRVRAHLAKQSNINELQIFQSKALWKITRAPFYASNRTRHTDVNISLDLDVAGRVTPYRRSRRKTVHPDPPTSRGNGFGKRTWWSPRTTKATAGCPDPKDDSYTRM